MNGYIEFRGVKNSRIAIGDRCAFAIFEASEDIPIDITTHGKTETYKTGCMVYLPGLPSFYSQDFYLNVVEKLLSVGSPVSQLTEALKESRV